jgi:tetratricopeptide (TPR) repeat protein
VQFRHALIRDAAYQSLLVSRRRELHRRVAEALAEAFPDTAQSQPELIARHYADAGDPDSAVAYWCRAGARAVELVANREAVTHYDNALAQLALTPPGRERDQRELRITLALGLPLIAATGYASQRVREAYSRARALSEELDDASSLFTATRGLWNCVFDRAELDAALELAQNLVRLAPATDRVRQSLSLRALGSSYMNRGALDDSVAAFDGCLAIPEGELSASSIGDYGEAPHSISLQYKGYIRCVQGRPAEGLDLVGQAVARTRALRHPLSLAFALFMQSLAQLAVRDYPAARATAEDTLRTAREHFLVFWTAGGKIALGCATAHLEGAETGLALAREGLEDWRATGARLGIPIFLSLIADAALAVGRPDLARATVAEALDVAAATGEYLSLADLQRLDGEVARRAGDAAMARRHFEAALETAERQGALLFALGGALGLARLFADDGRQEAARDALRAIVARFGPDTRLADLEAAQTLLC